MSADKNQNGEGNVAGIKNESISRSSKKQDSTKMFMAFIGAIVIAFVLWYLSSILYSWYTAEFPGKPTKEATIVDATNITKNDYVTVTWDELSKDRKTQKVSINLKNSLTNFKVATNLSEDHVTRSDESDTVYNIEFDVPSDPNTVLEIKITSDQFKEIKSTKQITD